MHIWFYDFGDRSSTCMESPSSCLFEKRGQIFINKYSNRLARHATWLYHTYTKLVHPLQPPKNGSDSDFAFEIYYGTWNSSMKISRKRKWTVQIHTWQNTTTPKDTQDSNTMLKSLNLCLFVIFHFHNHDFWITSSSSPM